MLLYHFVTERIFDGRMYHNIQRPDRPVKLLLFGESKKFTRLAGYGIKSMRPIFKTKVLIYQSKANLNGKILLGKIKHL